MSRVSLRTNYLIVSTIDVVQEGNLIYLSVFISVQIKSIKIKTRAMRKRTWLTGMGLERCLEPGSFTLCAMTPDPSHLGYTYCENRSLL